MGSATVQGQPWGTLARDWAAYGEQTRLPLQGAALDAAHVTAGTCLLDAGCGAGLLAVRASLRGARVSAFDAASTLLDIVAISHSGEAAVREVFATVDRAHTRPDGTIRYENVFLWAAGRRM